MISYSEIGGHVLMVRIIDMDQSAIGRLLHCTNRKVPMKISRWTLVPMEGDDPQEGSLSLNSKVLINEVRDGVCRFKGYCR